MRVIVTGGAGYIGSHVVVQLLEAGHQPVIVDNFSNSSPVVIDRLEALTDQAVPCHAIDVRDHEKLGSIFAEQDVDAVIHLAGLKAVGESTALPLEYYDNNLGSTISLVRAMRIHNCHTLVFSSSATVYGAAANSPLTEDLPTSATNPYGWSKVMQEQILRDVAAADPRWRIALLRYFNPVGEHPSGQLGEDPAETPNNLMPFVAQVAVGRRELLQVFGADYPTPDGTGRRDYIHVQDLASGHVAALAALPALPEPVRAWNLGTGQPTSVMELIRAFEAASAVTIPYQVTQRRPGDVADSWADPSRARDELGWQATRTVTDMCVDTWRWQRRNPTGYSSAH